MNDKEQIIVLHTIKHSDSGVVVQCYSREKGREALYLRVSQRNKVKYSDLHRLSILDIITYSKASYIPVIKEYAPAYRLNSIRSDVYKSTVAIFLSELLLKCFKEAEKENDLYEFMVSSINILENLERGVANFHLYFMVHLCRFLGIMPSNDYSLNKELFSIPAARFTEPGKSETDSLLTLPRQESQLLHLLMQTQASQLDKIESSGQLRTNFAEQMIKYMSYHLGATIELKSLDILHEVFN